MMENIIKYLNISFTKGIGSRTLKKVLDVCGSLDNLDKFEKDLKDEVGEKTLEKIRTSLEKNHPASEKILEKALKEDVSLVCIEDTSYPENLKEIPDPPAVLFVKGNLRSLSNSFAVVGTRYPSGYGKKATKWIVEFLSENGVPVVSGGAIGVDSIAHKVALEKWNYTAVVLGSGIDVFYPPSNKRLFEKIIDSGGAVISEYPFGEKPSKFTFPKRNRIVAGISIATVVIEAPEKSGSLITADLAMQYGRTVFAVPHSIDNPKGVGCNKLIREGAVILHDLKCVAEELPYLFENPKREVPSFSKEEQLILNALDEMLSIDEVMLKTGLGFEEVVQILTELELKGAVINHNGVYEKNIL